MISTTDFRRGSTKILWNDEPWLVIEFQHVKPGKGGAFVRTKMKNLITQRVLEETFRSGQKFPVPDLERSEMQYLYSDSDGLYHFLDQSSYEQLSFTAEQISTVSSYLKEGINYSVLRFCGDPILVEPPLFMELVIKETVPGVRGNTVQGGNKPATVETGLVVQVPLFVNEGDTVKIDTRDGSYIERV